MTRFFLAVLEIGTRATPVVLLALLLRFPLKKAPAVFSCALWWGVFLRLACPFFVPYPSSPLPSPAEGASDILPLPILAAGEGGGGTPLTIGMSEPVSRGSDVRLLAVIWLAGIGAVFLWGVLSYLRFRPRLVGAVRLRDNIWQGDQVPAPVTVGLFRPRIYLPSALEGREMDYVILHEQSHIKRGDPFFKLLAYLVLAVHWLHPLVWVAFLCATRDLEAACDERVLKDLGDDIRREYAASILTFAAGRRIPAGPLAFGEKGEVKGRIRRVLTYRKAPRWVRVLSAAGVMAALAFALLLPETAEAVPAVRQEAGPQGQSVSAREGTITFPAYREGWEEYNAAVYDITPFRVALSLPEGWSVRMPPKEARGTSFAFTPLWLYQGEEYAGSIAYNIFELYPDVPPEGFYRMVYNQLMLGSVVSWDNDYRVVRDLGSGEVASVQIMERQEDGSTALRPGILAYDRDMLVYVAIDLENGRLSGQEVAALAASIQFLPG